MVLDCSIKVYLQRVNGRTSLSISHLADARARIVDGTQTDAGSATRQAG